jgi:hypothetical protein
MRGKKLDALSLADVQESHRVHRERLTPIARENQLDSVDVRVQTTLPIRIESIGHAHPSPIRPAWVKNRAAVVLKSDDEVLVVICIYQPFIVHRSPRRPIS